MIYGIEIKRVMRSKLVLGIADGWLSADGAIIYRASDLKVGLFKQDEQSGSVAADMRGARSRSALRYSRGLL